MPQVDIGIDETDHFGFICPSCRTIMRVRFKDVSLHKHAEGAESLVFYPYCKKCRYKGRIKIYDKYYNPNLILPFRTDFRNGESEV